MQITGSIPFHVARAYGAGVAVAARNGAMPAAAPHSTQALSGLPRAHSIAEVESLALAARSGALTRLVGGTVNVPISFDGAATAPTSAALPLYTRAADKVEAAVAVNVGRALDVLG